MILFSSNNKLIHAEVCCPVYKRNNHAVYATLTSSSHLLLVVVIRE